MISPLQGEGRKIFFQTLAVVSVALLCARTCAENRASTVATFNIEEFPKSEEQIDGAFETIRELSAGAVALQEITRPTRFRRAVTRRLSDDWRVVFPDEAPEMRPGLLFDTERYRLLESRTHEETVVYDGARPVFEVELSRRNGARLELFVVHLKAGSEGLSVRRDQHRALRAILSRHANANLQTVVLGDFNSTEPQDRELLAETADRSSLRWLSRRTKCTGYWVPDGNCRSFDLDHVLAQGVAGRAISRGPCETIGCEPGERCPVFHRRVSDHCPLTAKIVAPQ